MKQTLMDITEDMQALEALLSEEGIDWDSPEVQAIVCDWATESEEVFINKVDNYGALMAEWSHRVNTRKTEAKRMTELARIDENNLNNLKERLKYHLEAIGRIKVETPRFRFTVAKNGGLAPLTVNALVDELPEDCVRTEIKPDNDAIRKKLEAGQSVYGCELGERGTSLRIK